MARLIKPMVGRVPASIVRHPAGVSEPAINIVIATVDAPGDGDPYADPHKTP